MDARRRSRRSRKVATGRTRRSASSAVSSPAAMSGAMSIAPIRVDSTFRFAANHHNTLEPSATTAVWDGDRLTLYDSTMGVRASQLTVAQLLGIPLSDVRVITDYVGGGFGGKAMVW